MPKSQHEDWTLSPEFNRELMRYAARDRLSAEDILDMVSLAEHMYAVTGEHPTALSIYNEWIESFDELEP